MEFGSGEKERKKEGKKKGEVLRTSDVVIKALRNVTGTEGVIRTYDTDDSKKDRERYGKRS